MRTFLIPVSNCVTLVCPFTIRSEGACTQSFFRAPSGSDSLDGYTFFEINVYALIGDGEVATYPSIADLRSDEISSGIEHQRGDITGVVSEMQPRYHSVDE